LKGKRVPVERITGRQKDGKDMETEKKARNADAAVLEAMARVLEDGIDDKEERPAGLLADARATVEAIADARHRLGKVLGEPDGLAGH